MKKTVYLFLVFFLVALLGTPALFAEEWDSSAYDGGSGSTLNEGPGEYGDSGVPDVGPSGPVGVATDEQGNNYSY